MNGGVNIYLQRKHTGQFCEEGLELVADGCPQVAGRVHGKSLHERGNVVQAMQHSAPCWQTLFVVQSLWGTRALLKALHNEVL